MNVVKVIEYENYLMYYVVSMYVIKVCTNIVSNMQFLLSH